MTQNIGVIGAGAWGTALAALLTEQGNGVTLWANEPEVVDTVRNSRENTLFLPGIPLPSGLTVTNALAVAVMEMEYLILAPPSHVVRAVASQLAPFLPETTIIVNCSKGIEPETGKLISDLLQETLPHHPPERMAFLSGPSFAREVAEHHFTAVVIASQDRQTATAVQRLFRTPSFLTFCHDDIIGVQVGGAVKNVLAIATGIADGLGMGLNTRAALLTRGLYETIKLGRALGANPLTFVGLAGVGDLILTCTGDLSRNRTLGMTLAQGRPLQDILREQRSVAEGVTAAKAVYQLIHRHQICAPICTAVYQVLYEGKSPRQAVTDLTAMELGDELGTLLTAQPSKPLGRY